MKKWISILLLWMIVFTSIGVAESNQNSYAKVKVGKVKSVKLYDSDIITEIFKFKWSRVNKASGYQLRLIDSEKYDVDVIKVVSRKNTTKTKAGFETEGLSSRGTYQIRLQVRAYKIKNNKKVYGPWSTSRSYSLFL